MYRYNKLDPLSVTVDCRWPLNSACNTDMSVMCSYSLNSSKVLTLHLEFIWIADSNVIIASSATSRVYASACNSIPHIWYSFQWHNIYITIIMQFDVSCIAWLINFSILYILLIFILIRSMSWVRQLNGYWRKQGHRVTAVLQVQLVLVPGPLHPP